MAVLVGNGFYLSTALGVGGTAAEGAVLSASTLGKVYNIRTNGSTVPGNAAINIGDSVIVDTDDDGSFADETSTTQTDNDRYINSTVTYADGSTSNVTLELISLSDGTQAILVNDGAANSINAASDQIQSITLGTFDTAFNNRYNQANFTNSITNTVVCFCEKTRVRTPTGERKIEDLIVGDEVTTAQNGAQKIVWIGQQKLSSAQLVASPHLKPVCIRAGALGERVPETDLLVSPQHRILIVSKIAKRMFGQKKIFVPAIKLVGADNIEQVASVAPVTYFHILFETHQAIFANGALAESLHTGPNALQALHEKAREEIFEIFPDLKATGQAVPLSHPTVEKQALVSRFLTRHKQNHKQLVQLEPSDGSS